MKSKKLSLQDLKVESFTTSEVSKVKGGGEDSIVIATVTITIGIVSYAMCDVDDTE